MNLEEKFKANLDRLGIDEGESVLIALSGGVDSVVLLNLVKRAGLKPMAAHANFKLRDAESEADEAFVKSGCEALNIPIFTKTLSLQGISSDIQGQARKLRYQWFSELMDENTIRFIFTAHHLDDRLETFFINFLRGTGLKGLKSIPERNIRIYRPLLPFRKEELIAFAKAEGIEWRDDSSNEKDVYLRNRIRQQVIPVLESFDANAVELAGRSLEFLAEADTYFKRAAGKFIAKLETNGFVCKIYDSDWDSLFDHPPLHKYVFEDLGFNSGQLEQLENLKNSESGRRVIGKRFTAFRDRGVYILRTNVGEQIDTAVIDNRDEGQINEPISLTWKRAEFPRKYIESPTEAWLSKEKLQFPLEIRLWQNGDRFVPFGMKGSKKVSDYLIDAKVSVPEKERTYVLLSDGEICWLIGHRIDDRYRLKAGEIDAIQFKLK
ncbi:tRNA lysidine(34) synthetase TilS [Cryomorphaceae bacterium 1068]|nr:tRNA lysidine(34) synthetase TilS [Cryomorphaceae bacterium 1068]